MGLLGVVGVRSRNEAAPAGSSTGGTTQVRLTCSSRSSRRPACRPCRAHPSRAGGHDHVRTVPSDFGNTRKRYRHFGQRSWTAVDLTRDVLVAEYRGVKVEHPDVTGVTTARFALEAGTRGVQPG